MTDKLTYTFPAFRLRLKGAIVMQWKVVLYHSTTLRIVQETPFQHEKDAKTYAENYNRYNQDFTWDSVSARVERFYS